MTAKKPPRNPGHLFSAYIFVPAKKRENILQYVLMHMHQFPHTMSYLSHQEKGLVLGYKKRICEDIFTSTVKLK